MTIIFDEKSQSKVFRRVPLKSSIVLSVYRILALEKLGAVFNQVSYPLQYTPRKFVIHPESSNLIMIETDYNAYTEATKLERKQQMAEVRIVLLFAQNRCTICTCILIQLWHKHDIHVLYFLKNIYRQHYFIFYHSKKLSNTALSYYSKTHL